MYEVYATQWDDPHIVEELIPARGLQFSMPLNDHTGTPSRAMRMPDLTGAMDGRQNDRPGSTVAENVHSPWSFSGMENCRPLAGISSSTMCGSSHCVA